LSINSRRQKYEYSFEARFESAITQQVSVWWAWKIDPLWLKWVTD
jgi:hypothetical protein